MSTKHPRRRMPDAKPLDGADQALEILQRTLALLVANGYTPSALRAMATDICNRMPEPRTPKDPERAAFTVELGHIITHWYTDPANLDARGNPQPLAARGPRPCIADLVRRASPSLDVDVAISQLVQSGSLKRVGRRYLPTGRRVLFDPRDAKATARGLLPLNGYLGTIGSNLSPGGKKTPLFEVTALNPAFPVDALEAFKARLNRRGMDFLKAIDNQMRDAEVRAKPASARGCVGVGLFMFEDFGAAAPSGNRPARRPRKTPRT